VTPHPPAERRLAYNLAAVEQRLTRAVEAAGRARTELTLVAVSKMHPASAVVTLAGLGLEDFGEARWQELAPKQQEVAAAQAERVSAQSRTAPDALRWHFLGRLQRNKARAVGAAVDVVHSLDRVELCEPLARGAAARGRNLDAFVQVSLDGDLTRGGASIADVDGLADAVAASASMRLAGLMAVAPKDVPARAAFARVRELSELLQQRHPEATSLSIGMSGDLEDAVAEGATHLRIGTALFGSRA
jgi:pyridoxal phosphate enzyme (YggS family)